jgi:hypothetical protein
MMKTANLFLVLIALLINTGCITKPQPSSDDIWSLATARKSDLSIGVYITAQTVDQLFTTTEGRREAISLLKCNGITTVYLEVHRCGLVISPEVLKSTVVFLKSNGIEVVGGIATLPGGDIGVPQKGPLTWLNWQNPKTQNDMRKIMEDAAPIFDTFIIDDFFCTSDTSDESKLAKGNRSWSEYRRALLTEAAQSVMIKPAKAKNPSLKIIIKYPQWYDRFHLFGYDLSTEPALFDGVWVGTETRGQYTQRYGFVQPYEGFINYRWIATLSGDKMGGAWFDHGDCNETDFIEQAYQSVLSGAKQFVIFNFDSFVAGHPGHHLLRQDFEKLADLAKAVAQNPVKGATGYKPVNSDAGGDLYLMDYIGMFGISFVPDSKYPENSEVILLPTQAAADREILPKVLKSLDKGAKIIMTTGFLANAADGQKLAELAGVKWPLTPQQTTSETVIVENKPLQLKFPVSMDYQIIANGANVLLQTTASQPFMTQNKSIYVINPHTFSQVDFDAVGEVLLCPRQIGLLELPKPWVNTLRSAFHSKEEPVLDAPSRVSMQQLADQSFIIHNYNQEKTEVNIQLKEGGSYIDGFTGKAIPLNGNEIRLEMAPRSRIWFREKK